MGRIKDNWEKSSLADKIFKVVIIGLSCIVIVLSVVALLGIINISNSNSITIPILGVITLLNGIKIYKKNKPYAIPIFCCSAFIFICCIAVFFEIC